MTAAVTIFLLFGLSCLLTKVDGRHSHIISIENDEVGKENTDQADDKRGLIGNLIGGLLPPRNPPPIVDPAAPINIPSPVFSTDQNLAPTFQVPNERPMQTIVQSRPTLLGGLMNIFNSREQTAVRLPYNQNWLNYALQKCSKVDPRSLTAILPTSTNGLRVPKMYYFQNETKLTWTQAQEWCTQRGMNLLTVNDAAENKVIIDKLRQIMAGNTPGTTTTANGVTTVDPNTNAFWIGLNNVNANGVNTWVGDGTSTFTDFYPGEPDPTANFCGTYGQATTVDNIHMNAIACTAAAQAPLRFICEVSDECMALFMSRFPTSYFHNTNNGNNFGLGSLIGGNNHHNGHVHYNPGGIVPSP